MQSNDRISRRYILHVVCFILIAVSLANRPLLADEPCAAADALLQAGFVDDAKLAYVSLLKGESKPPCARQGLKKSSDALLAKKLELAKFHEASGSREEAEMLLEQAQGLSKFAAEAHRQHGALLVTLGEYEEALVHLEKSHSLTPRENLSDYIESVRELAD